MKEETKKPLYDLSARLEGVTIEKTVYHRLDGEEWEDEYTLMADYDTEVLRMNLHELKRLHRFIGQFIADEERNLQKAGKARK